MQESRWFRTGGTLMFGLFVAYLDRINLSVALPSLSRELGFAGSNFAVTSSWVLTTFLLTYAIANFFGGVFTKNYDPKWIVIVMMIIWSLATLIIGFVGSIFMLLAMRAVLGIAEGVYWPQQSRFARAWFAPGELTRANTMIQYYGQYLALSLGFFILSPIYYTFGWRMLFYITGGLGLIVMVPLFWHMLGKEFEAPYNTVKSESRVKLSLKVLGGRKFILLVFSYLTQGMLFWGITLWLPMVVKELGYSGVLLGLGSASPYLMALLLGVPMAIISDKTGKRILIAALGLFIPGMCLMIMPFMEAPFLKLILIAFSVGYMSASFTANIWSTVQTSVEPEAVGAAAGIINGIGAGGGGTLAGFIVGLLLERTGSYIPGYTALGIIVFSGGISLLIFGKYYPTQKKI